MNILNLAAYRFQRVENLTELRAQLLSECTRLGLKGTIIIAPEGFNAFLAGPIERVEEMEGVMTRLFGHGPFESKRSFSGKQPFRRMFVKIKREIIPMGIPDIDPEVTPAPVIEPQELKAWIEANRDFTLLDTRNTFEVEMGTFKNARHLELTQFREFPQKSAAALAADKEKPLVMFCTGGIRCEKAALYLTQKQGFKNVLQLQGGILKYFEDCGDAHFEGRCFVFDERVALDGRLSPQSP